MLIALLLAGALAWWLHKRGELLPNLQRMLVGGALVFGAVRLLETGKPVAAALVAAGAVAWWKFGQRRRLASPPPPQVDLAGARALLGVGAQADAAAIRAAHRKLIAAVHPDAGGSTDLAARVTAARDLLLAAVAKD
jgi:hypothetical protein